jgi:hypothetical protein
LGTANAARHTAYSLTGHLQSEHCERALYRAERDKNGKLQMIAIDPEIYRLIIRHVFLHLDED